MEGTPAGASRSVTLLFTDIEGSTALWVDHPESAGAAVEAHDGIVAAAIAHHGGSVIKTTGDGFLASFPAPRAGIEAAIEAQVALGEQAPSLMQAAHVRMAIHTGRVEERRGDLFGLAVNKCERIMSAAYAGQILLSDAAAAGVRDDLPAGIALWDLGAQTLAGIPEPERVHQVVHVALRRDFPPLATMTSVASNLPAELTSFIGRERDVDAVRGLLGGNRLVTLVGEGGAGKTRLAIQVGESLLGSHHDGVWFIGLESLRDPELVAERFASTLGLEERAGRGYVEVVADHVHGKELLLVVDNCEHLLDAAAEVVAALLRASPTLHVLATSRQRLGVPGEAAYRVPSLSIPEPSDDPLAIGRYESVRLFIDRASLARPGFALTEANAAAVARIVRQLDGIPLAVELAAATMSALSPVQVAGHLDDRFRLLTQGARSERPRHQTLEAAIDWSYELLTDEERTLFALLSVFRGGFDLPAVEAVCTVGGGSDAVVAVLASLVEKSLVVADVDEGRYRLLESMRRYAAQRLAADGSANEAADRHGAYFVAFAERAGPGLDGPDQVRWLASLETERDNLRAALEWSLDRQPMAMRLSAAVWRFWLLRRRPAEGMEWLTRALATDPGGVDEWRVQVLLGLGAFASERGDRDGARHHLEEADAVASRIGDGGSRAAALAAMAVLDHKEGDLRDAAALFRRALDQARSVEDPIQTCRVLTNLALVLVDLGDEDGAGTCATEALAVSRTTDVPDLIADAMLTAAEIAINRGEPVRAKALLEEALRTNTESGVDDITAWTRSYLGKVSIVTGDLKAARALLGEAIDMFRTMESPVGLEWALRHLAGAELRTGEVTAAGSTVSEALRLASAYVRPDAPQVLIVAGSVLAALGAAREAIVVLTAANRLGREFELALPEAEAKELEDTTAMVSGSLSPSSVGEAEATADAMSLDAAVAYALDALEERSLLPTV